MTSELLSYALSYFGVGLNPFPLPFRSKVPVNPWKRLQTEQASLWELDIFRGPKVQSNIALMMGAVSGGAVALDFDDPSLARRAFGDLEDLAKRTFVSR